MLLVVVFACAVLGAPFEGNVELIQVQNLGTKDALPANMDEMKDMINSAMKETEDKDLGEMNNAKAQQADLQQTFDSISEDEAVKDEMEAEQKEDCVMAKWSKWTRCTKKCGGGETERERSVISTALNGGTACPMGDDGFPFVKDLAGCNMETCAEDEAEHEAKLRHLTATEMDEENAANKKVLNRAKVAPTVDRMKAEMAHWLRKDIKTRMIHLVLPGEAPPTDEELVQEDLKKAIAKNSVNSAMKAFDQLQDKSNEPKKESKKKKKKN